MVRFCNSYIEYAPIQCAVICEVFMSKNSEQRAIEVVYESPKLELPCKVVQHYHWGVESQHRKVDKFWAKNTSGYCEQKAEWLAMKRLRELNWDCKRVKKLS